MNEPLVAVRASALSGYPDCPRRSAARLFAKEIKAAGYELRELPSSVGASIGTAVHAGVGFALTEKARHGNAAPLDAITDLAMETLRERVAEGVIFDRETPTVQHGEKQALNMLAVYQHFIVPSVNPILVEERLEADTGFGILLTGQSDLVAREPNGIRDLKTGKRRSKHRPQIGAYSLLARSHGYDIEEAHVDFVQRTSLNKPQPEPESIAHSVRGCETAATSILRHIASDLQTWRHGDPARDMAANDVWAFPANPSSMLCSAKWCPAYGTAFCHEHQANEDAA